MNTTVHEPPPADPAAVSPSPAPDTTLENEDCALVVAIGNYMELTPLRGPGPDAIRFCTWLREKGGLKVENIKLVDANEQGKPVNSDIRDALIRLGVRHKKRRGRRLYFYYAGHGLGPSFNEVALVPADAAQDLLVDACLGLNQCVDFFVKTGFFDELVVFMDCCRERVDVPTIKLPFAFEKPFDGAKPPVNHFVMMAAGDGAKSFEVRNLSEAEESTFRGLMTTALIEGLNGAPGAIDAHNNVTSSSLSYYVANRVQQEATDRGLSQVVDKPKPPAVEIVFYKVPDDQIPSIDLKFVVGPQTAGQPVTLLNQSTSQTDTQTPQTVGEIITFTIKGNARYQLIVPNRPAVVVDPATLSRVPADVQLP